MNGQMAVGTVFTSAFLMTMIFMTLLLQMKIDASLDVGGTALAEVLDGYIHQPRFEGAVLLRFAGLGRSLLHFVSLERALVRHRREAGGRVAGH